MSEALEVAAYSETPASAATASCSRPAGTAGRKALPSSPPARSPTFCRHSSRICCAECTRAVAAATLPTSSSRMPATTGPAGTAGCRAAVALGMKPSDFLHPTDRFCARRWQNEWAQGQRVGDVHRKTQRSEGVAAQQSISAQGAGRQRTPTACPTRSRQPLRSAPRSAAAVAHQPVPIGRPCMRVDRVLGQRGCLCRQFAAQRCDEVVELIACGLAGQVGAAHACSIRQSNSQYINRLSASIHDVMVQSNGIRWGCEACRQRAERAEGRTEQRT